MNWNEIYIYFLHVSAIPIRTQHKNIELWINSSKCSYITCTQTTYCVLYGKCSSYECFIRLLIALRSVVCSTWIIAMGTSVTECSSPRNNNNGNNLKVNIHPTKRAYTCYAFTLISALFRSFAVSLVMCAPLAAHSGVAIFAVYMNNLQNHLLLR